MRVSTIWTSASTSSVSITSTSRTGFDRAVDVDDVGIVEAAHHVDDGGGLADVAEELVAEALAGAGAAHEAGDVDELDRRGQDALGIDDARPASARRGSGTGTTALFGSMVQKG